VRNPAINLLLSAIGLVAFVPSGKLAAVEPIYDVAVYGGFSGAVTAVVANRTPGRGFFE
jgi:hypothetical protein|tara:strand:- start:6537 stop:6713 length:177 start_codon:yes stop_codon:yes gene_type:complete